MTKQKIVIGFSGGMDSTTMLGVLLAHDFEVHACNFQYGSKHNQYESYAIGSIHKYYKRIGQPFELYHFDLSDIFKFTKSNLLKSGGEIPEGHYESENMKLTVVPGRNMIFGSIMAGLAESIGAEYIALGVHQGDHAIYPDCRKDFIKAFNHAVELSSDKKVHVKTPLLKLNKTTILKAGYNLLNTPPYHLTRTCYKDQKLSCGKCGSCQERLEAFANIGKIDSIEYENR